MLDRIDRTDRRILALLQEDARISNAEIARRVDLAPSAIFQRIRKLEQLDIIRGYTAELNARALGFGLVAFVRIQTASGASAPEITRQLAAIPEVCEIHRVVGEDCFFLKVRVADPEALEELLDHKIQPVPAVAATRTTIVLSTGKESHGVPIGILGPTGENDEEVRTTDAA
jgi:Lrp/AsnC family transcriptional regulator, leucine-responsive regulatory protein